MRQVLLLLFVSTTVILAAKIDDGLQTDAVAVPLYVVEQPGRHHHIPFETESDLNLTPSQIKIFAGHALNTIRSKCPAVDSDSVFQLQKYVAKFIASKMETVPRTPVDVPTKKEEFDGLIASLVSCAKGEQPKAQTRSRTLPGPVSRKIAGPDKIPVHKIDPPKPRVHLHLAPQTTKAPIHRPEHRSPFVMWIKSVMQDIKNFFANAFSGSRRRREVQKRLTPEQEKGREAIMEVIDQVCRLYCDECNDPKQITNFRMAVKELMQTLFSDENVLVVASHGLSESFIESLKNCGTQVLDLPDEK